MNFSKIHSIEKKRNPDSFIRRFPYRPGFRFTRLVDPNFFPTNCTLAQWKRDWFDVEPHNRLTSVKRREKKIFLNLIFARYLATTARLGPVDLATERGLFFIFRVIRSCATRFAWTLFESAGFMGSVGCRFFIFWCANIENF